MSDTKETEAQFWKRQCAELQRQLDEWVGQAKQESVIVDHCEYSASRKAYRITIWHVARIDARTLLYAHPPNLPAMIEQAIAEERDACAKACHGQADAGDCEDAIRARGVK